jgi:hypothetical protein
MMEAASTSETLVNFYQTTWCNIPEDSHLLKKQLFFGTAFFQIHNFTFGSTIYAHQLSPILKHYKRSTVGRNQAAYSSNIRQY